MWWLAVLYLAGPCWGQVGLERPPLADPGGGWLAEAARRAQRSFADCRRRTNVLNSLEEDLVLSALRMKDCLKGDFLRSLDRAAAERELPLTPFVTLINEEYDQQQLETADARVDDLNDDLMSAIYKRFSRLVDTHSFKFNFSKLWSKPTSSEEFEEEGEEEGEEEDQEVPRSWERQARQGLRRRRQQYRKAFPMMVAGYMMMSAFLVPLGFQFMAMIGGKALLLAKMAFFMSLFSGYKRLTNDLEYHHHPAVVGHHHDYIPHYPHFHHRSSHEVPAGLLSQIPGMGAFTNQLGAQLSSQFGHRKTGQFR